jgi:hypothetical protein
MILFIKSIKGHFQAFFVGINWMNYGLELLKKANDSFVYVAGEQPLANAME